jgi:ABC-type branched-subunit amino acid transport system substrate-binding protein
LDGQGKTEGGITPSNISWDTLTKVYGVKHPNGRQHPAYTPRALELAITRGIDPAGNKLQTVMPRYVLSQEDLADLVLFLERLGKYAEPGIGENKITIGTVVPSKGALAEMGQVTTTVIKAFFDELNSQGGIYNRRLELKVVETAETPDGTRANVERLINDEQVFAMTGAFIAGIEKEITALMAEKEVPLIGPISLYPLTGFPLNRHVFYLLPGVEEQACALIEFIRQNSRFDSKSIVFAYPRNDLNTRIGAALNERSKKNGLSSTQTFAYESGRFDATALARQFQQARHEIVFLTAGNAEVLSFLKEAAALEWYPFVFLPGTVGALDLFQAPPGFHGKVFISFPTSATDHTEAGLKDFRALASKYNFPAQHRVAQISAYTAVKILVEALKRAGKNLNREDLIKALEGLYEYSTGLTPAITYGPNRRIGAMGAHVLTVDLEKKQLLSASGWISIN